MIYYLFGILIFIHLFAYFDSEGVPYVPIELASLLTSHYTRKALFLAFLTPVTLLVCFAKPMQWSLRGIGISLFLITLFDHGNEWFLHLLGILTLALCLASIVKESKNERQRHLFALLITLYMVRTGIKLFYVSVYEMRQGDEREGVIQRIKTLTTQGCYNNTLHCLEPSMTPSIFRLTAMLQWFSYIILSLVLTTQNE